MGCAPLFRERLLLNREAVRQGKPLVDCAMYELEAQLTTVAAGADAVPGVPVPEPSRRRGSRRFPVFGAVAGVVGCLGAMEAIKVLAGLGEPLLGRLLDVRPARHDISESQHPTQCKLCRVWATRLMWGTFPTCLSGRHVGNVPQSGQGEPVIGCEVMVR